MCGVCADLFERKMIWSCNSVRKPGGPFPTNTQSLQFSEGPPSYCPNTTFSLWI